MSRLFDQDDEYMELPPERRTLPKVAVVLAVLIGVLVVIGFSGRSWYQNQLDPPGAPGTQVAVAIPKGTTINGVGGLLANEGVIANSTVFRFWARSHPQKVQAGAYTFQKNSSFEEAMAVIRKGPAAPEVDRVNIPEGLTLAQMVDHLAKADPRFTPAMVEAALADPTLPVPFRPNPQTSPEGLLFPASYDLSPKDTAATLIKRMAEQMKIVAEANRISDGVQGGADSVPELNPYEILTVASLIQAESGNPEESPKIARVIYNRLNNGEPLGIDATSRYLSMKTGEPIDFESTSPFNTRRRAGLPPTPINSPGEAAIKAALHPADGPWIYYVLEEKGRHFFTDSQSEFLAKKRECEAKGLGCG